MKENALILKEIAEKLLKLMSVDTGVEVVYDKESDYMVVNIEGGEATGLLIGKRGETLLSIQSILSLLFKQKTGEWGKIVVNIGDYRQKEEDYLRDLAETTAQRAIETGNAQNLYNLKAWQRRVVHLALADNKDVETTSEGEGEDRYLIINPKK